MTTDQSKYAKLGVDAGKERVRQIFERIVRNDFPGAFVNIARHPDRPGVVFTKHSDGDGSKLVQRILHFRETGNESVIQGAVDDAFSMNYGDIAASGFVFGLIATTQIVNINGLNVPKYLILEQIATRVESLLKLYRSHGFSVNFFMGGETADLPDQANSAVYDVDVYAEAKETDLVKGNVKAGDLIYGGDRIYGFASDGQASWEDEPNSGIMANGLTLARIHLMHKDHGKKYPYLIRGGGAYEGKFAVSDQPDPLPDGLSVGRAMLSPTRQWAILIRLLIEKLKQHGIFYMLHGISMNTGGGATKITNVGQGIEYVKKMPQPPPIFKLIQAESGESWRNMYRTFNCGVGLDVVGEDDRRFQAVLAEVSQTTGVQLFELGVCKQGPNGDNRVVLQTPFGNFDDYK